MGEKTIGVPEYLGLVVVWNGRATTILKQGQFIPYILIELISVTPDTPPGWTEYLRLVIATIHMLTNVIEWGDPDVLVMDQPTLRPLFAFIAWVRTACDPVRLKSVRASRPSFVFTEAPSTGAHTTLLSSVRLALSDFVTRLNLHGAVPDHFTRRLNSSTAIKEVSVIKILTISHPKIRCYTAAKTVLVSVIESDGPNLTIFARGSFGRTVWTVSELTGLTALPKLSGEVSAERLPPAQLQKVAEKVDRPPWAIPAATLNAHDERLRQIYGPDFSKWLDWTVFGFYYPFGYRAPHQRRPIVDFLATVGLTNGTNSSDVRAHADGDDCAR